MKKILLFCLLNAIFLFLFSQESLKSIEEEYYDFLSLTGVVERPTLGYRTLSDSVWTFNEVETFEENADGTFKKVRVPGQESDGHIWINNNLGTTYTLWEPAAPADNWFARGVNQGVSARVYGPEWFNSINTAIPYGQNDGALWQGRGYNTALTTGFHLEGYGFELTFKPQISWSQNIDFEFITPNYAATDKNGNQTKYNGKASSYGYYGVASIDAPQRFGDESLWTIDLGDTEVRYTWNTFTAGFGTQAIWLGPSKLNPIIHSNNAASYPKVDIGLRKTDIIVPYFGSNLGIIEVRGWWGMLSESDWFDTDENNNERLIAGLSYNYQFPFIKELTIGFNRTMVSKWNDLNTYTLFDIFVPFMQDKAGEDYSDGHASVTFDYKNSLIGFEVYLEWGRDDFQTAKGNFLRYPFHTQGWTAGLRKQLSFYHYFKGEIDIEITDVGCSQDYGRTYNWLSTFYGHHRILHGYTNKGQWLGSGIGTGGNSQYFGFILYYPNGKTNLSINRINPDLDYAWFINTDIQSTYAYELETYIVFGLESSYYFNKNSCIDLSIQPIYILSKNASWGDESWNYKYSITLKYIF